MRAASPWPVGGGVRQRRRTGRGRARALEPAFDAGPLLRDDLLQLPPDVAEDVADLEPLPQLLAATGEPIHEVLEPRQVGAGRVAAAPATLHQPAQRLGDVAVGHDVVRELIEDLVRAEVRDLLAPVPARVAGASGERRQRVVLGRAPVPRRRHAAVEITRIRRVAGHEITDRAAAIALSDRFRGEGEVPSLERVIAPSSAARPSLSAIWFDDRTDPQIQRDGGLGARIRSLGAMARSHRSWPEARRAAAQERQRGRFGLGRWLSADGGAPRTCPEGVSTPSLPRSPRYRWRTATSGARAGDR